MSEKKVGKRLLTWVLVLVMTLSLLPLNVLADEIPLDEPTGEEAMIDERDNVMDVSLDGIAERKSSQNYATWWPVFWGFDKKSEVTTANLIKVTAGTGNTVLYASEQLSAKEALQAQTATVGNAVNNNFQVVADPGYYVSQYRIVCGNHYGCGVSPYNSSTPVNTDGNYTSAITVLAPAEKFTHNKINGIFSKYPQQAPDPNDEDLYDFSLLGANQYYPYYLLIEVKQDTARYQAEYKWGELNGKLTEKVPASHTDLLRNSEFTAQAPSEAALEAARSLGYKFHGWKISGTGYTDNDQVSSGNAVTIRGGNLELIAQWKKTPFTVTYEYTGTVPAGAPAVPASSQHTCDESVTVAAVSAPNGYRFTGWVADDIVIDNDTFTMPARDVKFTGSFVKDDTQWYSVKYTWADAPEGVTLPTDTETYLGVAAAKAAVDKKYTNGYQFSGSDGYFYTFSGWNEGTVNGQVVTFTGSWTKGDKDNSQWYTVKYTWADAPEGVTLPTDTETYLGVAAAKDAVDKIYTNGKQVTGSDGFFYTFSGWDEGTVKDQVVTFNGSWTKGDKDPSKWATVTFNSNGGSAVASQTVKSSATATKPTNPTRSGYTFAGWYTDNEKFTTKYDFATPVTKNITLYAKWNTNYVPYYPPVPPTVKIEDDDALGLNTTDHFAYIVGYGNGEVRPQNNITRAEVATIFFRLLTDDVRDENLTKTNRYSDVAATAWYNTAVSTLSSMGIITGYPDGTFRPNAAITRAEFAAIAARFDNNGDKAAAKFSDIANHWAKDEISIAYNNGWITGYPNGTFGPQRDITRAETMTLVNRVLNRQPETEDDLLPNMTVWTDNANPKAWYYLAVQEATNSHYYKFKTNSKYEKWTELRETRDWTQLEK